MSKVENTYKVGEIVEVNRKEDKTIVKVQIKKNFYSTEMEEIELKECDFRLWDVVRITEDKQLLKSPGKENMIYAEYEYFKDRIFDCTKEELENYHEVMIGQLCEYNDEEELTDYAQLFMDGIQGFNYGYCIVKESTKGIQEFINSKYTSDDFKRRINNALFHEELSERDKLYLEEFQGTEKYEISEKNFLETFLGSNRCLNDLSAEELNIVMTELRKYNNRHNRHDKYLYSSMFKFLFNSNSLGTKDYLNKYENSLDVAKQILSTSGLNSRADYYSGRGVNYGDLNDTHLTEIFKKLCHLDPRKAVAMLQLVDSLKTLGATEFINSFLNLARVDYDIEKCKISNNNMEISEAHGRERNIIAFCGLMEVLSKKNKYQNFSATDTEEMKKKFKWDISCWLKSTDNLFKFDSEEETFGRR